MPLDALRWLLGLAAAVAAIVAAGHALLFKREPRAALGWIAVCLLFPAAGPLLYYVFGINRIKTRAKRLHGGEGQRVKHRLGVGAPPGLVDLAYGHSSPGRGEGRTGTLELVRLSEVVTGAPLLDGNAVVPLYNGEQAYPQMLAAIDTARTSVYLATYIFDTDETGRRFIESLASAHRRGVRTCVLVDGFGEWYSWPRVSRLLRRAGVACTRFLPPRLVPPQLHINLRNHRKMLIVDGRVAFVGGMNIGDRHRITRPGAGRVIDTHFEVRGPIVGQIEEVFRQDWAFAAAQQLPPARPTSGRPQGSVSARVVVDGPDEDLDRLATILTGAISAARKRVWVMTPYFLPPREVIAAIKAAALRGLDVQLLLPGQNNLPFVHWAARNLLWELLHWGVRVSYQPPPFVHTKLVLIDDEYVQVGSANLDPRSLRLNFELSLEAYSRELADRLAEHFVQAMAKSRPLSVAELEQRPLWQRLRDAAAWLFSPYL